MNTNVALCLLDVGSSLLTQNYRETNMSDVGRQIEDPSGSLDICSISSSRSFSDSQSVCFLIQDEVGQFSYDSLSQVHWVSFLDGRQRVLLFTEDVGVVTKARQAEELEQFQQEVRVSLQNLGLSLVNNANRQEIAYIGIPR